MPSSIKFLEHLTSQHSHIEHTGFCEKLNFIREWSLKIFAQWKYDSMQWFSSKLSLFFPGCKSRNNKVYTKIQLIHTDLLEVIMEDLKDESSNHNLAMYKKALQ